MTPSASSRCRIHSGSVFILIALVLCSPQYSYNTCGQAAAAVVADMFLQDVYKTDVHEGGCFDWQIHDPSQVITVDDYQLVAVAGKGNNCVIETWWRLKKGKGKTEKDEYWKPGQCLFVEKPSWIEGKESLHDVEDSWVPELVNQNVMLYSVSEGTGETKKTCVGVATSIGGFPNRLMWVDSGEAAFCLSSSEYGDERSIIDPSVFVGFDLKTYLVTGGGVIIATELDPETYKPKSGTSFSINDSAWHELARGPVETHVNIFDRGSRRTNSDAGVKRRWVEAAYILPHGKFYYLFVNWGISSDKVTAEDGENTDLTYEIRVGRSKSTTPFGPYFDKDGMGMMQGGGSLFLGTKSYRVGPGNLSVYLDGSALEIVQYHYYDERRGGLSWTAENRLKWEDEWLIVGELLSDFRYPIHPTSSAIVTTCRGHRALSYATMLVCFYML